MRDNMMSYGEIDKMMREQTVIHGANMWILMLAILIASIGLNVNSTAVIIGAMLVSPLMSGIMTMGYSIAVRDIPLFLRALVRFATQVAICLITSTIYFMISPLTVPTEEMIARTSPTVWDVLIAVSGGLAGMIGHTRTKHSNVIPGVAIATALMPPLCTAGYGIASGQLGFFMGAFYLFIINTLFIAISSAIITIVLKVPYHKSISPKAQRRVNVMIGIIAAVTVTPSVFFGAHAVFNSVIDSNISSYVDNEFSLPDAQVVKCETDKQEKVISISLVGATVGDDIIELAESRLPEYGLEGYALRVTQNVVAETDDSDKVTIIIQEKTISELRKQLESQSEELETLRQSIEVYEAEQAEHSDLRSLPKEAEKIFPYLKNCRVGIMYDGSADTVLLTADAEEPVAVREKETVERWLAVESGYTEAQVSIRYPKLEEESEQEQEDGESEGAETN